MKTVSMFFRVYLFVVAMVFVCGIHSAEAQEAFDTTGRIRIEGALHFGLGVGSVDVATTTDGETIKLSGGGGIGLSFGVGYGLTHGMDIDLAVGLHESILYPSVSNIDGTFTRSNLLATINYRSVVSGTNHLKFGIGLGYYVGGVYDVDSSQVLFGSHTIVEYDNALGFHLTAELEYFHPGEWSHFLRAKLYYVKYDASTATDNGTSVPVQLLISDIRELDGSGLDLILGISRYF